ncbi:MAG: hypothetical protein ACEPOV_00995 [Hyphomicrobiales bacterium]
MQQSDLMSNRKAVELNRSIIIEEIRSFEIISDAIIYGSSNYVDYPGDYDIFILVPTKFGMMNKASLKQLKEFKEYLAKIIEYDIDFVPHSEEELYDYASPVYNPRHNPSLVYGHTIKGNIKINQPEAKVFSYADLTKYVILDNRHVTRRQILRPFYVPAANLFLSKLGHLFGNALSYLAFSRGEKYMVNPSDLYVCAGLIEKMLPINCVPYQEYVRALRRELAGMNSESAFDSMSKVLNWYELFTFYLFYATEEEKPMIIEQLDSVLYEE